MLCEATRGKWVDTTYIDDEHLLVDKEAHCDRTRKQPVSELPLQECLVPDQAENWKYDVLSSEAGKYCNAKFLYTNTSDQAVSLIFEEFWDSNAQEGKQWRSVPLEPGEEWVKNSSYTWRPEDPQGDTYNYITRLMVANSSSECRWLISGQETLWEEVSMEMLRPCQ